MDCGRCRGLCQSGRLSFTFYAYFNCAQGCEFARQSRKSSNNEEKGSRLKEAKKKEEKNEKDERGSRSS